MVIGWGLGVFNTHFTVVKILIFKHKKSGFMPLFLKNKRIYFKVKLTLANKKRPPTPNC